MMVLQVVNLECPHEQRKLSEGGTFCYHLCELNSKFCFVKHGNNECETYNEYLAELEAEQLQ